MTLQSVGLPPHQGGRGVSVEDAVAARRSVRNFADRPIPLSAVSALLRAAQGVTAPDGLRAAPSAGALYPLALYAAVGSVDGLQPGVWRYRPAEHALQPHLSGDCRSGLAHAAMRQHWLRDCALMLVFAADIGLTVHKYGSRGERYVAVEAGAAAENAWLQVCSLGLGAAMVGAFVDGDVASLVGLPRDEQPMLMLAVGHRSDEAPAVGPSEA